MRLWRWLRLAMFRLLLLTLLLFMPWRSTLPAGTPWNAVALLAREHNYDWLAWLPEALGAKLGQALWGLRPFLDEAAASQFLRDYMADLTQAQVLEARIDALYTDPAQPDPLAASADLRRERDALRSHLRERQTLAESVLEGQLAAMLRELGFGLAGQVLPPVAMRFTQLPRILIVSPRDEIRYEISLGLEPLPLDAIVALEQQIEAQLDLSALIVPIGGIALYPAMILETSNIATLADTFAHEWLHHYLFAFPLGQAWDYDSEARVINETVASLFGQRGRAPPAATLLPGAGANDRAAAGRVRWAGAVRLWRGDGHHAAARGCAAGRGQSRGRRGVYGAPPTALRRQWLRHSPPESGLVRLLRRLPVRGAGRGRG